MYSSFSQRQSEAVASQCEATRSNPRHQTAYSSFSNQGKQMQSEAIGGNKAAYSSLADVVADAIESNLKGSMKDALNTKNIKRYGSTPSSSRNRAAD